MFANIFCSPPTVFQLDLTRRKHVGKRFILFFSPKIFAHDFGNPIFLTMDFFNPKIFAKRFSPTPRCLLCLFLTPNTFAKQKSQHVCKRFCFRLQQFSNWILLYANILARPFFLQPTIFANVCFFLQLQDFCQQTFFKPDRSWLVVADPIDVRTNHDRCCRPDRGLLLATRSIPQNAKAALQCKTT